MTAEFEIQLLTRLGEDNCDTAKAMLHIGDVPAARAALDAALENCRMLETLSSADATDSRRLNLRPSAQSADHPTINI